MKTENCDVCEKKIKEKDKLITLKDKFKVGKIKEVCTSCNNKIKKEADAQDIQKFKNIREFVKTLAKGKK